MAPGRRRSSWSGAGSYANLGGTLVASVTLGLAGGYWADRWLGTAPWLLLVGLGLGIAAAAVTFYRAIKALSGTSDGNDDA
jgi:ATP synthase protein I